MKKVNTKTLKAIGYIRISTMQAETGLRLEKQEKAIREYCKDNGIELVGAIECDEGKSGERTSELTGLQSLLERVKTEDIDLVLAISLSRLTRNIENLFGIMETLEKNSVSLITLDGQVDTTSKMGRHFVLMLAVVASISKEIQEDYM